MLLDELGVPLYWPTLFASVRLRNAGLALNSIKNKLSEVKVLLLWERQHCRDIEAELRAGHLLSHADVVSIRDFASIKIRHGKSNSRFPTPIESIEEAMLAPKCSAPTVSKQVHYNRLTTIADYVEFIGQSVTGRRDDRIVSTAIDRLAIELRKHRPRGMSTIQQDDPSVSSPPSEIIEAFLAYGSEGHPQNPFRRGSIQRRNELILRTLYETGIRRGELLSLRLDHIHTGQEPTITVRRTHDDRYDSRSYQPVAKTKERVLPITEKLAAGIHRYCMEDRAKAHGSNRHPYLFVTHRKGATCGEPISMATLNGKIFGTLQRLNPDFAGIHPHSFRHHMNYVISTRVDELNRRANSPGRSAIDSISEARELDVRAHLNGHRSAQSGAVYNRRHVLEKSAQISRDIQKNVMDQAKRSEAGNE